MVTLCTHVISKVLSCRGRILSVGRAPTAHFLLAQKPASEAHRVRGSEWNCPTLQNRSGSQNSCVPVQPGVVSLSGSVHHLLESLWWLWTRRWGAVIKEFFLIGEEPLRDRKRSSPWSGLWPSLITCLSSQGAWHLPFGQVSIPFTCLILSLVMQCLAELVGAGTWPRTGPGELLSLGEITLWTPCYSLKVMCSVEVSSHWWEWHGHRRVVWAVWEGEWHFPCCCVLMMDERAFSPSCPPGWCGLGRGIPRALYCKGIVWSYLLSPYQAPEMSWDRLGLRRGTASGSGEVYFGSSLLPEKCAWLSFFISRKCNLPQIVFINGTYPISLDPKIADN